MAHLHADMERLDIHFALEVCEIVRLYHNPPDKDIYSDRHF